MIKKTGALWREAGVGRVGADLRVCPVPVYTQVRLYCVHVPRKEGAKKFPLV